MDDILQILSLMLALFKVRVCIGYNYNHGGSVVCTQMMETVKVKVCEIFYNLQLIFLLWKILVRLFFPLHCIQKWNRWNVSCFSDGHVSSQCNHSSRMHMWKLSFSLFQACYLNQYLLFKKPRNKYICNWFHTHIHSPLPTLNL